MTLPTPQDELAAAITLLEDYVDGGALTHPVRQALTHLRAALTPTQDGPGAEVRDDAR